MFSIIIPLYNKEDYIVNTLRSILSQTFQEFEIVIVNDGSTDGSVEKVKCFDDKRIHLIEQTNAGVSAARNKGIEEARYDLIAFLDADDLWDSDFLDTAFDLYQHYPDCDVFALNYRIMTAKNKFHSPIVRGLADDFHKGLIENYFIIASQSDPLIWSSSVVIKKNALNFIGGFPSGIRAGEDLLTWAKLAAYFNIAYTSSKKATFNRIDEGKNTLPRVPDAHDRVGEELRTLLTIANPDKIYGLKSYIAFWYKIRLANFLRLKDQKSAKKSFQLMSKYAKKNLKYFIYAFLVYSPQTLLKPLNKLVLFLNTFRRKILSRSGH